MGSSPASDDLTSFAEWTGRAKVNDPVRVARAGRRLLDGAMRIRRGADGLYGNVDKPITKPAEAIGAWISGLEREASDSQMGGAPFERSGELKEAVLAAAEEVDAATNATAETSQNAASRLRVALLGDAVNALNPLAQQRSSVLPWVISGVLGGTLFGVLLTLMMKRK